MTFTNDYLYADVEQVDVHFVKIDFFGLDAVFVLVLVDGVASVTALVELQEASARWFSELIVADVPLC